MRLLSALAAAALGVSSAGCVTTETRSPAVSAEHRIRVATPGRSWEVLAIDEVVGVVVLFEAQGIPQDSTYMVRNVWHQDLGHIDAHGRAYRYLPHHKDPAWVGTGTVRAGVQRILDVANCELQEVQLPVSPPSDPPREKGTS